MKLIVRYVTVRGVGRETHDVTIEGERATIGRGTDQSIQIQDRRIPLSHSVLIVSGEKLLLKAESGYTFTVNDHVSRSAELNDGDIVDILGHQIKVIPGDDSAEYIVEVTIEKTNVEPLRDRFTTRLWQLNFPERKLAWLFFLSIIAIGVIVPSAGFFVAQ
ncbi:MAG: FHA domain-containing protein [Acidobacteria bacterium]|nr:FHA domain-containing protein [Acidobacteriota bacterium]